jgi:hypothetical protein
MPVPPGSQRTSPISASQPEAANVSSRDFLLISENQRKSAVSLLLRPERRGPTRLWTAAIHRRFRW